MWASVKYKIEEEFFEFFGVMTFNRAMSWREQKEDTSDTQVQTVLWQHLSVEGGSAEQYDFTETRKSGDGIVYFL